MAETMMNTGLLIGTELPEGGAADMALQTSGYSALFFVSLYCVHCVDLLPYLNEIKAKHPVSVVLFSTGDREDHEEMAAYFNWDFPILSMRPSSREECPNEQSCFKRKAAGLRLRLIR